MLSFLFVPLVFLDLRFFAVRFVRILCLCVCYGCFRLFSFFRFDWCVVYFAWPVPTHTHTDTFIHRKSKTRIRYIAASSLWSNSSSNDDDDDSREKKTSNKIIIIIPSRRKKFHIFCWSMHFYSCRFSFVEFFFFSFHFHSFIFFCQSYEHF